MGGRALKFLSATRSTVFALLVRRKRIFTNARRDERCPPNRSRQPAIAARVFQAVKGIVIITAATVGQPLSQLAAVERKPLMRHLILVFLCLAVLPVPGVGQDRLAKDVDADRLDRKFLGYALPHDSNHWAWCSVCRLDNGSYFMTAYRQGDPGGMYGCVSRDKYPVRDNRQYEQHVEYDVDSCRATKCRSVGSKRRPRCVGTGPAPGRQYPVLLLHVCFIEKQSRGNRGGFF